MKKTNMMIAISAAALFSGGVAAGPYTDRQAEDILHGKGVMNSSPSQPYVSGTDDQQGINEYLMYNAGDVRPARGYEPYERHNDDRDNSGYLKDNV